MIYFFLLSCSDNLLTKVYEEEKSIFVIPDSIDFGSVNVNDYANETVSVINVGTRDFFIDNLLINNENFYFDNPESFYIHPEETVELEILFEPENFGEFSGEAHVNNDDIDGLEIVTLYGMGSSSSLLVSSESIDFGQMEVGCLSQKTLTLKNIGNSDLTIYSINEVSSNQVESYLDFGSLPSFPWTLIPSQEIDISSVYSPVDLGVDQGSIFIESNDPANEILTVYKTGEGILEQKVSDTFLQSDIVMSDIIFVVDNSGSMLHIQNSLSSQIYSFMETINNLNLDYRLGFSSTDSSSFYHHDGLYWIDNSYLDPELWSQNVIYSLGTGGSAIERGIEFSTYLLQNMNIDGAGSFIRNDANLSIIYISDEKDQSTGGWNSYLSFFDSAKQNPDMLNIFSVIGDFPSGCTTNVNGYGRSIEFGEGYYDLSNHYNGSWFSICDEDWGLQLQEIASDIADRRSFALSDESPKEETIRVFVNGQEVFCWEYDEESNSVIFDINHIPEVNQTIEIEYSIYTC